MENLALLFEHVSDSLSNAFRDSVAGKGTSHAQQMSSIWEQLPQADSNCDHHVCAIMNWLLFHDVPSCFFLALKVARSSHSVMTPHCDAQQLCVVRHTATLQAIIGTLVLVTLDERSPAILLCVLFAVAQLVFIEFCRPAILCWQAAYDVEWQNVCPRVAWSFREMSGNSVFFTPSMKTYESKRVCLTQKDGPNFFLFNKRLMMTMLTDASDLYE